VVPPQWDWGFENQLAEYDKAELQGMVIRLLEPRLIANMEVMKCALVRAAQEVPLKEEAEAEAEADQGEWHKVEVELSKAEQQKLEMLSTQGSDSKKKSAGPPERPPAFKNPLQVRKQMKLIATKISEIEARDNHDELPLLQQFKNDHSELLAIHKTMCHP